jgi:uncharacterized membrane protein YcaP (DUF421 family)
MDLVIRAAAIYIVVFGFTRVLGRRELSSLQPFDLILLVVIGDLIQNGVTQSDQSVTGVIVVLSTIGILQVSTSFISYRFRPLRRVLQGEPIVLVREGEVIRRNLRRERLDEADLAEKARLDGIGSMKDIRWAVLETNGEISFIKRTT